MIRLNFTLISDTPACSPGQQLVYEVAKLSSVHVSCSMDANPDREIHFNWKFNTTANTVNIPVCLHYFCTLLLFFALGIGCQPTRIDKYSKIHSQNRIRFRYADLLGSKFSRSRYPLCVSSFANWTSKSTN